MNITAHNMTSLEFRQQKWQQWFMLLDINKDGILTIVDWQEAADLFVTDQNLKEGDARSAKHLFREFGELVFQIGGKGEEQLTKETFVQNLTKFFTNNPEKARRVGRDIFEKLVEFTDQNHDGFVSLDEWIAMDNAFGFEEDASREMFKLIGPTGDKGIENRIVADFLVEFALGGDETKYSEMVPHFPKH